MRGLVYLNLISVDLHHCYPTMQSENGHYCSYMLIETFYTYVNNKKKETIVVNLYIKVKNWNPIK